MLARCFRKTRDVFQARGDVFGRRRPRRLLLISAGPDGLIKGRLGDDMDVDGGAKAARQCGIAILAQARAAASRRRDRRLYPIYAHCEDHNIPIMLMGGGNTGPDVSYSSPEHIDRVLNDFPTLTVISSHGNWPWAKEIIHVAFRRENLYISPDMYLHNLPGMDDYVKAANSFLSERFLFATAYPLTPLVDYTKWFLDLPIKAEAKENIMYRNAERLLAVVPTDGHTK